MAITRPTKITRENSLPTRIEERASVYAKSFNELVEIVEEVLDLVNNGETSSLSNLTTITANVNKPTSTSVASGGTITADQLLGGLITGTGATGSWQLPTTADITTALGTTPAGTNFEFIFNANGMTATNTATLVVGTNMTVMSSPPITGGGTLTVTQNTQVVGLFRIFFNTATTCKISRIA